MRIVWIAVAALLVGTAGPPCAEGFVGPKGKWWHLPRVSESLNLTDQEKAQLDEKYMASRRRLIELKSALERERLELETLMEKEPLDEAAVMQRYGLLDEARSRLSMERFRFLVEVRKILGVERFRRLKSRFQQFRKALAERRAARRNALRGSRHGKGRGAE